MKDSLWNQNNSVYLHLKININLKLMDWLHIIAVVALVIIGVVIYINKRQG